MQPFRTLQAIACPLPLTDLDTDQLIPARFMTRSRSDGYGRFLLNDLRFDAQNQLRTDCPLNLPDRQGAQILVTMRNFGSGSSREAAVYALVDYGIRCVVAPSFGDIFAANAVNNGLLPARVSDQECEAILAMLTSGTLTATVDLEALTLQVAAMAVPLQVDAIWRMKLLNGWDDIDLTRSYTQAIAEFERSDSLQRPWKQPSSPE